MTVKLLALYKKPNDEAAFLAHYHDVHMPLVLQTPHLTKTVINRVTASPVGEPHWFLVAEMHFPDRTRFDEAMASPENRTAGKDLMRFARELVTLLVVEEE